MKFSLPLAVLTAAASVDAAALASPEADPWCLIRGQSCWKVKRAADAFADAIHTSGPVVAAREAELSDAPGHAAFVAKRQLDELALAVALATGDPEDFYSRLALGEHFSADNTTTTEKAKRDASPEEHVADKRWCLIRGQSCWKARRAAEAVVGAIESVHDPRDVPFAPEARVKRDANPWCLIRGQSCWKRDAAPEAACNAPSGACTVAKRDLHAIYSVARSILDEE